MHINLLALIGLINGVLSLGLGFLVFMQNKKAIINITYFIFDATIALFNFGYFFWQLTTNPTDALFWFKILTVGIFFINVTFFHVSLSILGKVQEKKNVLILFYLGNLLFVVFSFNSLLYSKLVPKYNFGYWPIPTKLFVVYLFFWLSQAAYGLWLLYKGFISSIGHKKEQIRYFMIGCFIGFIGGATNWPLWFNIPFPPYLNILIAVHVPLTAYAIVKHRLMDIEVVIKKTLVFGALFAASFGTFVGITLLTQELFAGGKLLGLAISSVIIILAARPLEDFLTRITEKYLFQKEYDRQEILRNISQIIVGKTEFVDLNGVLLTSLLNNLKLESATILSVTGNKDFYEIITPEENTVVKPDEYKSIVAWHTDNKAPLIYDALDGTSDKMKLTLPNLKQQMKLLRSAVTIPVYVKGSLFWVIALSEKKSGRAYVKDDITMFEALSHELTIALDNILNFQELKWSQMELMRQENLEFVSVLVKGLAHEILNPLMPLMMKIESLETDETIRFYDIYERNMSKLDEQENKNFKEAISGLIDISKSLKHNAKHIHLILDTLRTMQKGDEKSIGPIDLKSFFKQVMVELSLHVDPAIQKGVDLSSAVDSNLPPVAGNPTLLKQILLNLYKNACEAMQQSVEKKVVISCGIDEKEAGFVIVEVSDTGPGISSEGLSKVFTKGFSTKGSKGSGIGLNQCKTIIEKFGGKVSVTSQVGKGSRFILALPIVKGDNANAS